MSVFGKLGKAAKQCHSFVPGTDVLLADGTHKNIEDVEIGDKVLVTDPETGETTTHEVVATITTEDDKHFTDLTITTDDGPATLTATTTHPFWSPSEDQWVNAEDLTPGTTLHTPNGQTATLTTTHHYTQHQTTHDLTINNTHTYYVLADQTPILVHNSDEGLSPEQRRSVRSFEDLITEHEKKLSDYLADPDAFDNKGYLKNAPNEEVRQRIIQGRARHLRKEIQTFRDNINKITRSAGGCQ